MVIYIIETKEDNTKKGDTVQVEEVMVYSIYVVDYDIIVEVW